ncbi:TPA: hypothetical protein ACN30T_004823, partial [Vibrio parahaemolyticus]
LKHQKANKIIIKMKNTKMKNFKETEIKVESKKELLLSLMTKAIAAQKESLLSRELDVDYMIEESGTVRDFFEEIILSEDDVCKEVLWEFIDIHELDYKFDLFDCSFYYDEISEMRYGLINELTDHYES